MNPNDLWFNTPDSGSLCRGGGNGPNHPSQLYAIKKYVTPDMTFLDYGSGSGTTFEALMSLQRERKEQVVADYLGLDIIPKNVDWCRDQFPGGTFKVNTLIHKITQGSESWDVVYSRHVVDHMESFEKAMDEHCRVARRFVIVVLWVPLSTADEHQIKNIIDQGKTYADEYTNSYSKKLVFEYLKKKEQDGWVLRELTEDVGSEVRGHDTVIVLERR